MDGWSKERMKEGREGEREEEKNRKAVGRKGRREVRMKGVRE